MTRQRMTEEEWGKFEKLKGFVEFHRHHFLEQGFHQPTHRQVEFADAILAAHRELVWARKVVEETLLDLRLVDIHPSSLKSVSNRMMVQQAIDRLAALAAEEGGQG